MRGPRRRVGGYYIFLPTVEIKRLFALEIEVLRVTAAYASSRGPDVVAYEYERLDARPKGTTFDSESGFNKLLRPCTRLMALLYGAKI